MSLAELSVGAMLAIPVGQQKHDGVEESQLKRLAGLWRDTWWLWLGFAAVAVILSIAIEWFFALLIPCLPVPFVYFAINRYDEDGREKPDL